MHPITLDTMPFLPTAQWTKVVDAQKKTCMCSQLSSVGGTHFTAESGGCLVLGLYSC